MTVRPSASTPRVGFQVRRLPLLLRVPTLFVDRLGLPSAKLTPENLLAAAAKHAGLPPRFPAHVGEALERLCRSYVDDAGLHWFGRMNQWRLAVTGLSALLRVEEIFRRDPTLDRQPLIPPLIVVGLPRSGTTFLHRLLSAADDARPLAMYEHLDPIKPRGRLDTRRLVAELEFRPWYLASKTYGMDAIHRVRPDLPDECNFGMRLALRSMIYWATAPVYGYLEWLLQQDLRESYRLYRRVLLLHQMGAPGKRLTLKCPHHLAWLPALFEALPEALVVQTHRDPVQTVPSECKLILSLQALSCHHIDWRRTVAHNYLKVETFAARALSFDRTEAGNRVLHVDYRSLLDDPVGLSRDIRTHFGLPFTNRHEARLSRFASDNRQHKYGKNRYGHAQFELTAADIEERFAAYRERFVPRDGDDRRPGQTRALHL